MMGFCPHCEKEVEVVRTEVEEEFDIRGERIPVSSTYLKCLDHGHLFEDPGSDEDPIDEAYRQYRARKNMLQPEEIVGIRAKYGLTQNDLSKLLGWGGATLSRYENGALQSASHDKLLRLASEPQNLVKLIEDNIDSISAKTAARLLSALKLEDTDTCPSIRTHFANCFSSFKPGELNGYVRMDVGKLENAFLFFCRAAPVVKTKMNKLLFYADFKHFKDYGVSITGAPYARLPYGPAPHLYDLLIAFLHLEEENIIIDEQIFGDFAGEVCQALRDPDISVFSPSELSVLAEVAQIFAEASATKISELSHKEIGYKSTANGQLISYEFAEELSI